MMKCNPVWPVVLAVVALFPQASPAQMRQEAIAIPPQPIYAGGTDLFRYLLAKHGVKPITEEEWKQGAADLADTILVILGDDREHLQQVPQVLRQGGAVLIARDDEINLAGSLAWPGRIEIAKNVVSTANAGDCFAGRGECPFAVPLKPSVRPGPEWDLFGGLDRIATNHPSFFLLDNAAPYYRLAGFPRGSQLDHRTIRRVSVNDPSRYPLAIGSSRGGARFLAVADPEVFTNEMMVPVDGHQSHNVEFADRVVKFLSERDEGREPRTRCLFYEKGQVVSDFSTLDAYLGQQQQPPIRFPNLMDLQEKLVDAGNQIIDRYEENGGPSATLLGREGPGQNRRLREILRALVVLGAVFAVWVVVRRVWGSRQPTDIPPPLVNRRPADGDGPAPGVFLRRQREILRRNNLYEPVRTAVREFFANTGIPTDAGPKPPKVVVADVVRRPDTLRKAITDLWKIAYGRPAAVTVQKWKMLEPLFVRVQQAHADGKWRFVVDEETLAAGKGIEA